jgi:hypothetical protein
MAALSGDAVIALISQQRRFDSLFNFCSRRKACGASSI